MDEFMEKKLREAQYIMLEMLLEVDKICKENNLSYWLTDGTLLGAVRHQGFIPWDDDLDIAMPRKDYNIFKSKYSFLLSNDIFLQTKETDKYYSKYMLPLKLRSSKGILIEKGEEGTKYNQGIFIDIFPFDNIPSNILLKKLQDFTKLLLEFKTTKLWTENKNLKNLIKKFIIFPLRELLPFFIIEKLQEIFIKYTLNLKSDSIGYGIDLTWRKKFNKKNIYPLKSISFENHFFYVPNNYNLYLKKIYGEKFMELPSIEKRRTHAEKIEIY